MTALVPDIISLGGLALQKEDEELRGIYASRGLKGGLLNTQLEDFYRFVFWRGIVEKYDSSIQFTHDEGYVPDLRVKYGDRNYLFEMKYWKEEHSRRLEQDIKKLAGYRTGGHLVVFTQNPSSVTEENLTFIDSLSGIGNREGFHQFRTQNSLGNDLDFWVGAWHVPSGHSVSLHTLGTPS